MTDKRQPYPVLFEALARGGLMLTVNKRLARKLRERYDQWMTTAGQKIWRSPELYSLDAWLNRTLTLLDEDAGLLPMRGALHLWERVIERDVAGTDIELLQIPATARRAQEAHQLLVEYGELPNGVPLSDDHRIFLRWRKAYLAACREGGWFDASEVPGRIGAAVRERRLTIPEAVVLAGFDEISPGLQRLAAAMTAAGAVVSAWEGADGVAGDGLRTACADPEEEVRTAARWARRLLEQGAKNIGIVVVDLQQRRTLLEQVFREEIDPESLVDLDQEENRFSLSLGTPLADQGLVAAALELLGLGFRSSFDTIGYLLRTPYLGGSQRELYDRARFDRRLRSLRRLSFSLHSLRKLLTATKDEDAAPLPELARIFGALAEALKDGRKRLPGEWVKRFSDLLAEVGWPGERPLGSVEFQAFKNWTEQLLPSLVALEPVTGPIDRNEAVALLRRLANEAVFQPESPGGPLQVLGLLESSGLSFDHLWLMGMTDESLPAPVRPNPFIPVPLQIARNMPHAGAERELHFAKRVLERLRAAASQVIFSYPLKDGDVELRPSPLIEAVPQGRLELAASNAPLAKIRLHPPFLETLVDEQGPPLPEGERAAGGTTLLKDQALCPFRAFAHHRLRARALESPEPGLAAVERGNLAHRVLEEFWREIQTHARLASLDQAELTAKLEAIAQRVVTESAGEEAGRPIYLMERRRLVTLIGEWLDTVERKRTPFAVLGLEDRRSVDCGGVVIDTQADRIDELPDGRRIIIDYKTGRVDVGDLLGERLLEPQLPIYGGEEPDKILSAVAFGMLRRGETQFKGVAEATGLLPKVSALAGSKAAGKAGVEDWPDLLARWRWQLAELGDEFARGWAAVDPVNSKKACEYCDLAALCRVDADLWLEDDSE